MDNLWNEDDAAALVAHYTARGVHPDLALRTYSARLLGRVPRMVMHGGGNTSVKFTTTDLFGDPVRVLCVKGSGRDLGTIEPDGHPAVRLEPLQRYRQLEALSDEDMVNAQRQNLLDTGSPNPSVETLLHAFLPHKFIDHTHAVTATAIAALPDLEIVCRTIYGRRVACVPYVMPGFALARTAAAIFDADPTVEGLMLANHGIFTFADTARRAYDLMIEFVTLAERHIAAHGRPSEAFRSMSPTRVPATRAAFLPVLRGLLAEVASPPTPSRWILATRTSEPIKRFADGQALADYAARGVATPEQVIRIKSRPCLLPPPDEADLTAWRTAARMAIDRFVADYRSYFERNNVRVGGGRKPLDPLPRLFVIPGIGIVGVGADHAGADIALDIGEAWIEAVLDAEAIGTFRSISEADHFDMEYWSLEQAKLGKSAEKRFSRHVVIVTGGAGVIGAATAKAFAALGADVALLDVDGERLGMVAAEIGRAVLAVVCDVTDRASVVRAFDRVQTHFGGVDVVVSNAGAARSGRMADLPDATLRAGFELNFFAHQTVAQAAVRVFREQGAGGALLFNVSKQAINPGEEFGAYGTPKAALLALVRQYALEHGRDGIRVNAVNPDRIRSGLLSDAMIAERAAARRVTEAGYMQGNLLGREVRAEDVAHAFIVSATLERSTGNVITVDGGNVAAMLR
jgi:rhamnose utilization protein RhaD (predicted bifunctional aldolase and dehydrogenase)/NAD(P)-dependent dehydrogenase (short-subunit alcohol dehydrogenase family)